MAQNSKIEWTDHTFNPWIGCTNVSPGCDHCYAESWSKRSGLVKWGNSPRRRTSEAYWRAPFKWQEPPRGFKRCIGGGSAYFLVYSLVFFIIRWTLSGALTPFFSF